MFKLKQLFKQDETVKRYLAAPLVRSRLTYLCHRAEHGAKPSTLRHITAFQVNMVRYLELGEEGKVTMSEIQAAAQLWASQDPAHRGGDLAIAQSHFVSHAAGWLRFMGRLKVPATSTHPYSAEVEEFTEYMRQERGWSDATIRYRRKQADDFLRRYCVRDCTLSDITIATIDRALSEKNARNGRTRCRATIRNHADALRAFFRFAESRGWSTPGLATAIVAPRVYRDAALPAGPSPEDMQRLLATSDGDSPANLRDRALLLTLSVYGLRACEACGLRWTTSTGRRRCSVSAVQRPAAPTCSRCRAASGMPLHAICMRFGRVPKYGRSFFRSRHQCVRSVRPRFRASYAVACYATVSTASVMDRMRFVMPLPNVCWTRVFQCKR